ncbi:hypothetical protein EJ08DRAFT_696295 [Tothia fuscella]|uniref:T6SS Phospholipase effector Tle1-like catalytic domain-containing protein n=1 Tax=Tothia fuscella TaxID=1048955 RepID=A0A9P4U016_9PEZI|nr:hypothetical protein EJ08DRAFT_696295 [Tothia fuscella]
MGPSQTRCLGAGLAVGTSENVREAYGFLVNNFYEADPTAGFTGDSLFLIGYSRGAFTARSVAGLIGGIAYNLDLKINVNPKDVAQYVAAYAAELRRLKLTREVDITAIGVFDTVGSLGLPVQPCLQKIGFPTSLHSYRFFDTSIDDHVQNAFQALTLDEHRSAFSPTIWERQNNGRTNLKQVWSPGVHSNIGGGADGTEISDITLAWMMSQLCPFLSFNGDYLTQQIRLKKEVYHQAGKSWKWGQGALPNSMKLPYKSGGKHYQNARSISCH